MPDAKRAPAFALDGTALKLIALVSMTVDHVGYFLFPEIEILRYIGRLAFPIFAYMIGEGCLHTHDLRRYFVRIFALGVFCQVFEVAFDGSWYLNVLLTFSGSIVIWYFADRLRRKRNAGNAAALITVSVALLAVCEVLPRFLTKQEFEVDYGFWGMLIPVAVALLPKKPQKITAVALLLCLIALHDGYTMSWFALCAVPLLILYNGKRGKWRLKYLFYVYYPLHVAVLSVLDYVLHN